MKKLLVVGVIVLFLGLAIAPSTGTTDVKKSIIEKESFSVSLPLDINGTMGKHGWYISPIWIWIEYDPAIILEVWYSITETPEPDWKLWIHIPFTFGGEGRWIFQYKWKDIWGNVTQSELIIIKIDYSLPEVEILKPELGRLYLFGFRLFRINRDIPLMIGKSTIIAGAHDNVSGIHDVTFSLSIENETITTFIDKQIPYEFRLKGRYKGTYNLTVEVEDRAGLTRNTTRDIEIIKYGFL